jgi:7-cyano-7-deazaguanine synthase
MQKKTFEGRTALVLLSGGQDSTTCLWWAIQNFSKVRAIGFDYGQRHKVELQQAARIAYIAGEIPFEVIPLPGILGGSSLTDHSKDHNAAHEMNADLPASFTAGRNALFLTIAVAIGYGQGITDIVTGTCQADFSGYPDCRRRFIDAEQVALTLALDQDIRIHTPLMYLTKAETWRLAKELGCLEIVVEYSVTDYNGDMSQRHEWGYGNEDNPATKLRANGFREAQKNGWI